MIANPSMAIRHPSDDAAGTGRRPLRPHAPCSAHRDEGDGPLEGMAHLLRRLRRGIQEEKTCPM